MPSRDVVLEAVWEPITYNIMFSSNTPVRESFTVAGTYALKSPCLYAALNMKGINLLAGPMAQHFIRRAINLPFLLLYLD